MSHSGSLERSPNIACSVESWWRSKNYWYFGMFLFITVDERLYFPQFSITSYSCGMIISGCASNMAPTKLWLLRGYLMNITNVSTPSYNLKSSSAGERKCDSAERNRSNVCSVIMNYYIKHGRTRLTTFLNTEKRVENSTRSGVFLTSFEVSENVAMTKNCLECLIYLLNRN